VLAVEPQGEHGDGGSRGRERGGTAALGGEACDKAEDEERQRGATHDGLPVVKRAERW